MTGFESAIATLSDALLAAVAEARWAEADAEIESLGEEVLAALLGGRSDDLEVLARAVACCHTALRLVEERSAELEHRLGQLHALGLLVTAGFRRRAPRVDGPAVAAILAALAEGPLTGQDLAERTGLAPDAVALTLPDLRAAGLIRSWPAGRLVVNEQVLTGPSPEADGTTASG